MMSAAPIFSWKKLSRARPITAAGMVLSTSSQASFSSRVTILRRARLPKKALRMVHTSRRISTSTATKVPR